MFKAGFIGGKPMNDNLVFIGYEEKGLTAEEIIEEQVLFTSVELIDHALSHFVASQKGKAEQVNRAFAEHIVRTLWEWRV